MYNVSPGIRLVLASASPRRMEMLARIGLDFDLAPAQVDETLAQGEAAEEACVRLAHLKAAAALAQSPGAAVLAADTLVAIDGQVLGKPTGDDQARDMLRLLAGREHRVVTGFCLMWGGRSDQGLAQSKVRFRELVAGEIESYLQTGEPRDKAGAYAVQGAGAAMVESVSGSYTNVVGLPLAACVTLLLRRDIIRPKAAPARDSH